jgi:hypothetical protein
MGTLEQVATGQHVYPLRKGQRTLYLFFAIVSGFMSALFFLQSGNNPRPAIPMLASIAFAASSVYLVLVAVRSRLVLDGAHVRVQGALQTREFDLIRVEGYRTWKNRYQSFRVICLKDPTWKIPLMKYATDPSLDDWLAGLKDLDQQDRQQLLDKIDQDPELGATPEERRSALSRAKLINIVACAVDGLAAAAFAFGPAQYRLAALLVTAIAPAVAASLLYRQPLLYGILTPKRDPRADVSPMLMISAFGLLIGASRVNFVSNGLLLPWIVVGVLASLVMFYPGVRNNPRFAGTMVALLFLSALYGWGLAASVDTTADSSIPVTYTVEVLGGHVSHGRSTTYYLTLEPWGPYNGVNTSMKVSAKMYHATHPGQLICLALHAGALHAPWYEPVSCANGSQSANP